MERFCDELRWEREQRKVSIERICEETKVSPRHLIALEAGEYSSLPGGVFRKGIVRSYVSALGLDEGPWIERFEKSLRESGAGSTEVTDWSEFAQNVKNNRSGRQESNQGRWLGVWGMLVLLVVLAWVVWRVVQRQHLSLGRNARVEVRMGLNSTRLDSTAGITIVN